MGKKKAPKRPDIASKLFRKLMERSFAIQLNAERTSYTPWFKETIVDALEQGMSYEELSEITAIPVKTLENFKATVEDCVPKKKV
jgi:DNA-directed RNA polymerase specialized sigma24 family protein